MRVLRHLRQLWKVLTHEDVQRLAIIIHDIWSRRSLQAATLPTLDYDESVKYFVENRPADDRIVKGALLLQPQSGKSLLTWVFLDVNNEPVKQANGNPYGRQTLVEKLDEELLEYFDGKSLMVFE
jgi:hypothetical protein